MIPMAYYTLAEQHEHREVRRRDAHYASSRGKSLRGAGVRMRQEAEHRERMAVKSTVAEIEKTLKARARINRQLEDQMLRLPAGNERQRAVVACQREGISASDVGRLLGVSRQRVGQMIDAHAEVPF